MKELPYFHVDVFTDKPLSGNGLTVFTEANGIAPSLMQRLTQEMRQFESIFLQDLDLAGSKVTAKVFTCEEELDFAGHPILGAAAVLHDIYRSDMMESEWEFRLNRKDVWVKTGKLPLSYRAEMNQGP